MTNPYSPPKASVEGRPKKSIYSKEYKREKSAIRPLGVVLIAVLFFAFSVAGATLLMMQGDLWWIVHAVFSGLLAYWFRNLWWGDERERKIAVFVGFIFAALSWLGSPEGAFQSWPIIDLVNSAEACYFLLSACYLVYVRKSPFFETSPAL